MARPMSALRVALASELVDGPGTTTELWRRLGCECPVLQVRIALRNMVAAGEVRLLAPVAVPGVRRPVPVYARAGRPDLRGVAELADGSAAGIHSLIAVWAGLAGPAAAGPGGAAM